MNFVLKNFRSKLALPSSSKLTNLIQTNHLIKKFSTKPQLEVINDLVPKQNYHYKFHFYESKYRIHENIDNDNLINFIKCLENSHSLNEKIYLLFKISQALNREPSLSKASITLKLQEKIDFIKFELQNHSDEELMIGTLALGLSRFDFLHDEQLWLILGDHVLEERFFLNFEECLNGLEGLRILTQISGRDYYDRIFCKLEEGCFFTDDFEELPNLIRISKVLSLNNNRSKVIFEKIARLVSERFMSKTNAQDLMSLALNLVSLSLASLDFLIKIQKPLLMELHKLSELCPQDTKDFLVKIIRVFSSDDSKSLDYRSEFFNHIEEYLISKDFPYQFDDIITLLRCLPAFSFAKEDRISQSLIQKLLKIQENIRLSDIVIFYDIIAERYSNYDFNKIPTEYIDHFDEYVASNIDLIEPQTLYSFIHDCNVRGIMHLKKKVMQGLIFYILKRFRDHQPEQLYEYYTLYDSLSYLIDLQKIKNELTELQDYIRLVSYVRGFG